MKGIIGGWVIVAVICAWMAAREIGEHPEPSFSAWLGWGLFYVMGLIAPWIWVIGHRRLLRQMALTDARLQRYVWMPVILGALMFVLGLRLIGGR